MITKTDRFEYLDLAKGVGILAVVWAHIMLVGWSHKVIYAFHMPLFFFISGMLFRRDKHSSFLSFLGKRAKRLLLPYVIYSIVTWGVWAAFRLIRHDPVESFWAPLLQTFIAQGSGAFMVHNSALWFIPCLFVVEVMYWAVSKLKDWQNVIVCFVLAGLSFLSGHIWGNGYWFLLPYNFDAALIALPFYSVGNILIKHHPHKEIVEYISSHRILSVCVFILGTILLFVASLSFGECSMGSSSYQCNGAVFLARAFLGCFLMVLFCLLLCDMKLPKVVNQPLIWFGKNSLDVMCLHIPIKGVAMMLVAKLLHTSVDALSSGFWLSLIPFVLTLAAMSVIIMLVNRFFRR